MNSTIIRKQYIDSATGAIRKEEQTRYPAAFDDEEGYVFWAKKGGAKSFSDIKYPKEMTLKEIGQMSVLSKEMWSNTNMLGYRGHGGVIAYDEDEIGDLIGLKTYQTRGFIRKMIQLGMMAKVHVSVEDNKYTQFYINPIYFFGAKRLSLNLYLIFKEQLDRIIPGWVRREFSEIEKRGKGRE